MKAAMKARPNPFRKKQRQHRPKTRAPHGSPIYTKQIGAWVTKAMFEKFHRRGGSAWLRRIITEA